MSTPAISALMSQRGFGSTCWVTVRAAAAANDAAARDAREQLCKDYWYPLYAYLRRSGHQNDAGDIIQDFLVHILQQSWLSHAEETRGRFRSFLLSSLENFVRDSGARQNAKKRAGSYCHLSVDLELATARYAQSTAAAAPCALAYELEWAAATMEAAMKRLEDEYAAAGNQEPFRLFRVYLQEIGNSARHEEVAAALDTTVGNVQVRVHRFRKRYGALLREEVGRTVATPEEINDEVIHLRGLLGVARMA